MNRRSFLKTGAIGTFGVAGQAMGNSGKLTLSQRTPTEIERLCYPVIAQKDKDFDLTSRLLSFD